MIGDAILEGAVIAARRIRRDHHVDALCAGKGLGERETISGVADAELGTLGYEALQMFGAAADRSDLLACFEQAFGDDVTRVAACSHDDVHDALLDFGDCDLAC